MQTDKCFPQCTSGDVFPSADAWHLLSRRQRINKFEDELNKEVGFTTMRYINLRLTILLTYIDLQAVIFCSLLVSGA